jgi:tight adherence protein C
MTAATLLGAVAGLGLAALLAGMTTTRPPLAHALAALHPTPTLPPPDGSPRPAGGWVARAGAAMVPTLTRWGLPRPRTRADLATCGRDPAQHLAEQAGLAGLGLLTPAALAAIAAVAGTGVGVAVPAWISVLAGAAGFYIPQHALRRQARRRRDQLRQALSSLLDLVVVSLAGGAGVEQALHDATTDTRTWAQRQLRHAIRAAHLARLPPWATLGELGARTHLGELSELATALALAGTEGARVRATLTARAASLREHQLADAEAAASSATEKMSLPVVALFAGFLVFIGYPALTAVLTTL